MNEGASRRSGTGMSAAAYAATRLRLSPAGAVFGVLATVTPIVLLDLAVTGRLSLLSDVWFVLVCAAAALTAGRSAYFTVGVLPPLLMLAIVSVLTLVHPEAVTADHLAFPSTVLTGLALHAGALIAGHATALGIIARRHVVGQAAGGPRQVSGSAAPRP